MKSEKTIEIIKDDFLISTVPRHTTGTVPGRDNMKGMPPFFVHLS